MSTNAISKAFEAEVDLLQPVLPTALENVNFNGSDEEPYQVLYMRFTRPENPTMGDGHYRQRGYCQLRLVYPSNQGGGDASARADAIRDHFRRGLSMTADGVTTIVDETPEIGSGSNEGDRYVINVFVRFYADIFG